MPEEASNQTRAGFVALLGAPNAGKSTLMNRLVGSKVSIVSPKVQTTRTRVLGICLKDASQVIFVDTPGIFSPRRRLDRAMVSAAWQGAGDADLIVLLIDAAEGMGDDTRRIIEGLKSQGRR
ncbi:MAG: 50S ribosome-binding GTPase, partial [Rhodospirillales bacterium]|nr:50S ribosome-binding GTPase [Rhodospirillales bacterium]